MRTYLEKAKERKKRLVDSLRKNLRQEAYRLIQLLKEEDFKFKKIYLFGSILSNKPLAPWSDIDLAIEGLHKNKFFKLYAWFLKNSKFSVDLKPWEELNKNLKEKIIKRGEIIYERR